MSSYLMTRNWFGHAVAKLVSIIFITSAVVVLTGCMPNSKSVADVDANGRPIWTQPGHQVKEGVVRSSPLHFQGREKTREMVLDQSLVELSKSQFGTSISLNSKVSKTTQAYNDNVGVRETHIDYAEITSANDQAKVRAQIKAEWYDAVTQRLYLWVVPLQ